MSDRRAVVLPAVGRELEIREFPGSEPQPGAVVASVSLGGVCGTDVHLQDGRMAIPTPLVLGHEADANGAPLEPGDLIGWASNFSCGRCSFCVKEQEPALCEDRTVYGINQPAERWPHLSGGWADEIYLRPGSTIVRIPEGVSAEQAIALGCAGPTIVHGLLGVAPPRVGDVVVVQGSGPVGLAAAMYSRLAGAARVILVGGPGPRLDLATELGMSDLAFDIFETADPQERVRQVVAETPAGSGADLVVEATGAPGAVAEGLDICRKNGRYLVVGQYTDHGPVPLNPHLITRKQLQVLGSWAFTGKHYIDYVASLPLLAQRFDLARLVTRYDLTDANDALADMRSGATLKPVLGASQA
jgi:threonine dehydrogenase-like Zn-dependent dehydrogenase